ncbi:MAG: multiple sugar transport system permease protein [Chloroflexota bacterium]|jgi:multiple sugar transport system permease protein/sorbitol/mannitol transport system permease protein|nr:multiple sugar transport system permease protein [Chloroflexota bacterium]
MTGRRPVDIGVAVLARVAIWLIILASLLPIYWMVTTSFKNPDAALQIPPNVIGFSPTLDNYVQLLGGATTARGFGRLLLNSIIVAVASTGLALALGLPAAYALARVRFRGKRQLAMWILSTTMFPPIVAVIPVFLIAGNAGFIDTYPVLIVPYTAFNLPLVIWMLRSAIRQIPAEIEESALVDGSSRLGILRTMVLPLAAPGIAAAAVLSVFLSWNEFLFALTLTRSAARTAPVGINEFTTMFGTEWGNLSAGATLVVAPILVLALLLGRRLVSGLTFGAVK